MRRKVCSSVYTRQNGEIVPRGHCTFCRKFHMSVRFVWLDACFHFLLGVFSFLFDVMDRFFVATCLAQ